ncbi:unnamed protein product [Didymodactylos carnosus]|uniref:Uncharacterized protein n=1 Tax=Didymodactylos carnosus TaxID=1234261 RepID=A0A815YQ97_9BILA|nr:unnamed protein product [Didymodactylos carnosus]CAF1573740.1 unnamed protein product [Didymodactylos carnosus]CAF4284254.1 unnamed protein product [Didymodactylos carnosus]CAF4437861.1 unnamed protein product [Didymodactylos carnosus]
MTNYNYGYGRNIIYDFHEIELWLKQKLNKCKLIDTETVRQFDLFHCQFATFDTEPNLIIKIREHIQQEELPILKQEKLKDFITENRDNLLKVIGSLDHIFTYLQYTSTYDNMTLGEFIETKIICLKNIPELLKNENVLVGTALANTNFDK